MEKKSFLGFMLWLTMGFFQGTCAEECPKLTFSKVYDMFVSATPQNFTKEKTTSEKLLAVFSGDQSETPEPEVTFMVANVRLGDQDYVMVSRDDLSRLKDGGERSVFGGGRPTNRGRTSFYPYSEMFQGDHCAYALAYGPGTPVGSGLDMLRFELYLKEGP